MSWYIASYSDTYVSDFFGFFSWSLPQRSRLRHLLLLLLLLFLESPPLRSTAAVAVVLLR